MSWTFSRSSSRRTENRVTLIMFIESLGKKIAEHEAEARSFRLEFERGSDLFESACGQKYHEGRMDALCEAVELARQLDEATEELAVIATPSIKPR